jgi:hypothetical protein
VDAGIAEIVSMLSEVQGLQTIESCQGEPGERLAYVDFWYGDWRSVCEFVFDRLAPPLQNERPYDALVSVEVFNGSRPSVPSVAEGVFVALKPR